MATLYKARWAGTVDPNGTTVLWRAMNWKEFKSALSQYGHLDLTDAGPMDLYMEIYSQVVVAGPHPSEVSAGIAAYVALHQLRNNPYSGTPDAIISKSVEKRTWLADSYLEGIRAVVGATFHIPFETMDEWEPDLLFERLVQAEYAIGAQFNPVDPRQPKSQVQGQPQQQRQMSPREISYLKAKDRRAKADLEEAGMTGSPTPQEPPASENFSWGR